MDQKLFILATIILFLNMSIASLSIQKKPMSFRATIIHRNAKGSPLHNPDATEDEIREKDFQIGKRRAEYMHKIMISIQEEDEIESDTGTINESSFIIKFKIGTPAIDTFGYLDTCSGLSWVQCSHCTKDNQQNVDLYDMKKSLSLRFVSVDNPMCSEASTGATVSNYRGKCYYKLQYANKSKSWGVLATETFGFNEGDKAEHIVFGCSTKHEQLDLSPPALIGLGNISLSLVRQLYYTNFQYTLFYNESSNDLFGVIDMGSSPFTDVPENSIPLIPGALFYRLNLESITVNGERLNSTFEDGIIIDSGSTYTHLSHDPYNQMRNILIEVLGYPLSSGSGEICYETITTSTSPKIRFQFKNYKFYICTYNMWYKNFWGRYCLAIKESPGRSVLGMYQQRGMSVEYDLRRQFVRMDYIDGNCHMFP